MFWTFLHNLLLIKLWESFQLYLPTRCNGLLNYFGTHSVVVVVAGIVWCWDVTCRDTTWDTVKDPPHMSHLDKTFSNFGQGTIWNIFSETWHSSTESGTWDMDHWSHHMSQFPLITKLQLPPFLTIFRARNYINRYNIYHENKSW